MTTEIKYVFICYIELHVILSFFSLDNCAHGNYIGAVNIHGRTCEQIVSIAITECYNKSQIGLKCCGSCAIVSSGVPGKLS